MRMATTIMTVTEVIDGNHHAVGDVASDVADDIDNGHDSDIDIVHDDAASDVDDGHVDTRAHYLKPCRAMEV